MSLTPFEVSCLEDHARGSIHLHENDTSSQQWLRVGLWAMLSIGARIRRSRITLDGIDDSRKADGSPVTDLEQQIEDFLRATLEQQLPGTQFMGEESGAAMPGPGVTAVMDPIDGTWAFLSQSEACATTLVFFEDGVPRVGLIMNPATGEIGYTEPDTPSRLLQLPMFGEEAQAAALPTKAAPAAGPVLVNVHPSRRSPALVRALYRQWNASLIRQVKSTGGSPGWAMLEAAKGHYVYVNLWSNAITAPYDLAAAVLLLRNAGGDVVGADGRPVDSLRHRGPFIAGIDAAARECVLEAVREAELEGAG